MFFICKVISTVLTGCTDPDSVFDSVFFTPEGTLKNYGPYEETFIRFMANHPNIRTREDRNLIPATPALSNNHLLPDIDALRFFIDALQAKTLAIQIPALQLPDYDYAVTFTGDNGFKEVLIPANIFREELFRKNGEFLDKYIRRTESRKILAIPLQQWPKINHVLQNNSRATNKVATTVLATINQHLKKNDYTSIPLPAAFDHFSNQIAMIDTLLNALLGFEQSCAQPMPCIIETTSESEAELYRTYIADYLPRKLQNLVTVLSPGATLPQKKFYIECPLNNILALYNLSHLRTIHLLSKALYKIVTPANDTSAIAIVSSASPAHGYLVRAAAHNSFEREAWETPRDWISGASLVTTPAELRAMLDHFDNHYRTYVHQYLKHIIYTDPAHTHLIYFSNRYYPNEAAIYEKIVGTIKIGSNARMVIDVDLSIQEGGELLIPAESSFICTPETAAIKAQLTIGSKTTAYLKNGHAAHLVFGDESHLALFEAGQTEIIYDSEGIYAAQSIYTGENSYSHIQSAFLRPNHTYGTCPEPMYYDDCLDFLAKKHLNIISIDDQPAVRTMIHDMLLPQGTAPEVVNKVLHVFPGTKSFEQEEQALNSVIFVMDHDLGPESEYSGLDYIKKKLRIKYPQAQFILFTASDLAKNNHAAVGNTSFEETQRENQNINFILKPNNINEDADRLRLMHAIIEAVETYTLGDID